MSNTDFNFTSDTGDFTFDFPASQPRTFPWKWVIIGGSILAVIGVVVALVLVLGPKYLPIYPERTVINYYEALNAEDYELASTYVDQGLTGTGLQLIDYIKQQLEKLAGDTIGTVINVRLQFIDMQYRRTAWEKGTAVVDAEGRVRIIETNSNLSLTLPYSWSHNLVKRDGKWLIVP